MKPSLEQRALDACKKYAHRWRDVNFATKQLQAALAKCPWSNYTTSQLVGDGYFSHLDKARKVAHSIAELEAMVAPCEACKAAHLLCLQRSKYRKQLGAAKRNILRLGREAVTHELLGWGDFK